MSNSRHKKLDADQFIEAIREALPFAVSMHQVRERIRDMELSVKPPYRESHVKPMATYIMLWCEDQKKTVPLMAPKPAPAEPPKPSLEVSRTPAEEAIVEVQAAMIRPTVQLIRLRAFGSEEPPFATDKQAREWKRDHFEQQATLTLKQEAADRLLGHENEPLTLEPWEYTSEYGAGAGVVMRFVSQEAEKLDGAIGWGVSDVVRHILTGALPTLGTDIVTSYYRIPSPGVASTTITFRNPDLKLSDLQFIYRYARQHLGLTKKKKSITDRDLELFRFFNQYTADNPNVWADGIIEGYRRLQQEWTKRHQAKWSDKSGYDTMRRALERAFRKVGAEELLPRKIKRSEQDAKRND